VSRAVLVVGTVSVAILFSTFGVSGQGSPTPPETGSLSAAIEEAHQSPFHTAESILYWGPLPLGIGVTNGWPVTTEASLPSWSIQSAAPDSSISYGKVLFATWATAATSNLGAFYVGYKYGVLALPIPILGTAFGATLGGARFLPSLVGSAVGFGVALPSLFVLDADDSFLAFIAIPATIQAGVTTLIASAFH